jgi:4-amino-4-deoxy-L-arabinose transferase-like glycosyltransferase
LALLAAPTWNVGSHFNSLDMGVSGALACVLAALLMAQHPQATPGGQRRWMWVCWVAMGVAVLTKGLIGLVLPGLVLVVYTLLARDWALWRRLHLVSGMAWLLLVTAPWFVLVSLRNPEFAHFFFIHEHWQRYTTTVHQRMAPWWYFGPQLLLGFLPWLGLLPRMGRTVRHEEAAPSGFRPALMLAVWAVAIVLFFSASGSKLPGYILPVFPALAVLAALALDGMAPRVWVRQVWTMLVLAGAGLLVSPLVERATSDAALATQFHAYAWWVGGAFALVLLGLVVALMLHRRAMPLGSMVAFALAMFVGSTVILQGHETMGRSISGVDLVPRIQSVLRPDMPIYSVRLLDHTLPFYLGRTTIMVEQPDELEFGLTQEPAKWQPTLAGFRSIWSSGPRAVAIMSPATYVELKAAQWPMYLLTEDDRRVVVTNFISPPPQP